MCHNYCLGSDLYRTRGRTGSDATSLDVATATDMPRVRIMPDPRRTIGPDSTLIYISRYCVRDLESKDRYLEPRYRSFEMAGRSEETLSGALPPRSFTRVGVISDPGGMHIIHIV